MPRFSIFVDANFIISLFNGNCCHFSRNFYLLFRNSSNRAASSFSRSNIRKFLSLYITTAIPYYWIYDMTFEILSASTINPTLFAKGIGSSPGMRVLIVLRIPLRWMVNRKSDSGAPWGTPSELVEYLPSAHRLLIKVNDWS